MTSLMKKFSYAVPKPPRSIKQIGSRSSGNEEELLAQGYI